MKKVKQTFFRNYKVGAITIIALFLMAMFVTFVGPEITGSTVIIHPQKVTLQPEPPKNIINVFDKQVKLEKIFNPTDNTIEDNWHVLLSVDGKGYKKVSVRSPLAEIQEGKTETVNGLKIKVLDIRDQNTGLEEVVLEIVPANQPKIQESDLADLWHPITLNNHPNAIIVAENQIQADRFKRIINKDILKFYYFETIKPKDLPENNRENLILIGTPQDNPLIRQYLKEQNYDPDKFLERDQGYLHLIFDSTKKTEWRGKMRAPQAIFIITGESPRGVEKAIDTLNNKELITGTKHIVGLNRNL